MDLTNKTTNRLRDPRVRNVLDRLYNLAKEDKFKLLCLVPRLLAGFFVGKGREDILTTMVTKDIYFPVSSQGGYFIYQTARAIGAKIIVEFGTSFGISTIHLASAVKDNNGDLVISTEIEANKHKEAVKNLAEAGLGDVTDIRLGDALKTLDDVPYPIDMVLLDGRKELYLPVLNLLKHKLRKGAVVCADNIYTFKKSLKPYIEYMQSGEYGFESITLPIGEGLEYSVYVGD